MPGLTFHVRRSTRVQILRVLGMVEDLSMIAKEDVLGRRLQDESLPQRKRAPRKKTPAGDS